MPFLLARPARDDSLVRRSRPSRARLAHSREWLACRPRATVKLHVNGTILYMTFTVLLQAVQHEATWFFAGDYLLSGGGIL